MPLDFLRRPAAVSVAVPAVLLLMLYASALYFQAVTAFLSSAYQPGIESLRVIVSPGGLLVVVFLVACFRKSYAIACAAMLVSVSAILVSALMLAFMAGHGGSPNTWRFPEARSLSGTVRPALFQPSFFSRSIASVVGNGFLAVLVLGGSVYLSRRRHDNPVQRTGPDGPSADLPRSFASKS